MGRLFDTTMKYTTVYVPNVKSLASLCKAEIREENDQANIFQILRYFIWNINMPAALQLESTTYIIDNILLSAVEVSFR